MISPLRRRRAVHRLKFARATMNNQMAALCIVDTQGRFTLVNSAAQQVLGWTEGELLGRELHSTIHRCTCQDAEGACPLEQAALAQVLFQREHAILRRKDGSALPVTYLTSPLMVDGRITGASLVFHDVAAQEREMRDLREREERSRLLVEAVPEPVWLTDPAGYVIMANQRAAHLFGYAGWMQMAQIHGLELFDLEDRVRVVESRQRAEQAGRQAIEEFKLLRGFDLRRNGEQPGWFPACVRISSLHGETGKLRAVLYTVLGDTPLDTPDHPSVSPMSLDHAVARTLSGASRPDNPIPQLLQTIAEHGKWDVGVYWQLDAEEQGLHCETFWQAPNVVVAGFEALCYQLGLTLGVDLPGRVWQRNETVWVPDLVVDGETLRSVAAAEDGLHGAYCFPLSAGGALQGVMEFLALTTRQHDPAAVRAADAASAQIGWYLERHQSEQTRRRLQLYDPLTGLPNRSLLHERLRRGLFVSREVDQPLALFIIDLDDFQQVNTKHGTALGDHLLRQVGDRLRVVLRGNDSVARLDADTFAILLQGTTTAGALTVAEKIAEAFQHPFVVEREAIELSASTGVALYPDHAADAMMLLQAAEAAMIVAKRSDCTYALCRSAHLPTGVAPAASAARTPPNN